MSYFLEMLRINVEINRIFFNFIGEHPILATTLFLIICESLVRIISSGKHG